MVRSTKYGSVEFTTTEAKSSLWSRSRTKKQKKKTNKNKHKNKKQRKEAAFEPDSTISSLPNGTIEG